MHLKKKFFRMSTKRKSSMEQPNYISSLWSLGILWMSLFDIKHKKHVFVAKYINNLYLLTTFYNTLISLFSLERNLRGKTFLWESVLCVVIVVTIFDFFFFWKTQVKMNGQRGIYKPLTAVIRRKQISTHFRCDTLYKLGHNKNSKE